MVLSLNLTISWAVVHGFFSLFKNIKIVKILIYPWSKKKISCWLRAVLVFYSLKYNRNTIIIPLEKTKIKACV
jgi:hypothetical protein